MQGERVGQYQIEEQVGQGGMGDVYRAHDTVLGRDVALKFLPVYNQTDDDDRASFLQEARNAAAVEHPHIATIYEIGEAADGRPYISMPYYAGKTLAERLTAGEIAIEDAIRWARQAAEGLERAHSGGLVHRDIKPANLALDADNAIKILDFGIAELGAGLGVTRSRTSAGTAAYISPEQAQDAPVDHRTDLWALGVVLYQLLTSELPFDGSYDAAIVYAVLNESPQTVHDLRPEIPLALSRIVEKALAKDPVERFQSARELIDALALLEPAEPTSSESPAGPPPSLAVLPFANLGGEAEGEYFSDGLTEELIATLSALDGLHVVSRTSAFQFKGKTDDVREVGRKLNVASVLEGSVRTSGKRIRVTVQLVDAENGFQRWSERFDREIEDVFAIQDEIAQSIAQRLRAGLERKTCTRPPRPTTANTAAYDAYLRGRQMCSVWSPDAFEAARQNFDTALAADPAFAPAHSGLADLYVLRGFWGLIPPKDAWPKAKSHALRALALDENLAEAHVSLGAVQAVYDRDFEAARRSFLRAIELRPSYVLARDSYARFYLVPQGHIDEAIKEMRLAAELDPLCPMRTAALGWTLLCARDYGGVREQVERIFELAPGYLEGCWQLGIVEQMEGNPEAALEAFRAGWEGHPDNPQALAGLARAHAFNGDRAEAQRIVAELDEIAKTTFVSPTEFAWITVGLGDYDATIAHLERAYEDFDAICLYVPQSPIMDPLHGHPGFGALIKKMGLRIAD